MNRHLRIAYATSLVVVLAACGNKGPLVLPQKPVDVPAMPVEPVTDENEGDATAAEPSATDKTDSSQNPKPADPPKQDDGD